MIRMVVGFYAAGMFVGSLRIGIRTYINKKPGIEEIVMAMTMLFRTGDVIFILNSLRKGTNQMPPEVRASLTPEEIRRHEEGSKAIFTAWFCYIAFIWGAKTCLLLFYRRILERMKRSHLIKITAYALGITCVACYMGMFLVCRPIRKNWQVVPDPGRM